jgi:ATP-dependent Lhr-like helicase
VALPFGELERVILPARIADYHPRMLDELGAAGELVWIGAGALGMRDGRVILLRRDRALALAPEPTEIPNRSAVHDAILEQLATAGASFLVAIETAAAPHVGHPPPREVAGNHAGDDAVASRRDLGTARIARSHPTSSGSSTVRTAVTEALWDLVWAGLITNDTFAPLRSLAAPATRRLSAHASFGGRWSLVSSLGTAPTGTQRGHALATALLERWGIAGRAGARADELPGGFTVAGEVLRAMEDAGTVRRGLFVASLEGAQFAWPAAIDRLREAPRSEAPRVDVLSAVDPALAWGNVLPWPQLHDPDARPARRAGATAILVAGELAVWVEPKGKRLATGALPAETIELALAVGLPRIAARAKRRELLVETIDGVPAGTASLARGLLAAGARVDYRGLVVRGTPSAIPAPLPEPEPPAEDDPDDEA